MKYILSLCAVLLASLGTYAQHTLTLSVRNAEDKAPLAGATVTLSNPPRAVAADSTGLAVFPDLAAGTYSLSVSFVGFEPLALTVRVPQAGPVAVLLEAEEEEHEEEVVVQATRTSRTIANIPTRIEVVSGEELAEKANMKPGELRMLLSESTGIQVQQTSATSYNSSIRIQGLDGRYTQILKDGYPLYTGFSGGLSIMQIVPLDLRQVEVIKGSSSTLYGGGAIAGLVNLVSKVPAEEREISFLANGTTAGGLDLSGFYSQKWDKAGVTVFGSRNTGRPYDPADIGLTAIPQFERYTLNPRLFLYGAKTTADVGFSYVTEDRVGGSVDYIKRGTAGYFEDNKTDRFTTQLGVTHRLGEHSALQFKNSYSRFDRQIAIPAYRFGGLQQSSFSELTYDHKGASWEWIVGANVLTDDFREEATTAAPRRDYHHNTFGVFVQNQWSPAPALTLETGLRGDYVNDYGFALLPRVSAMLRLSPKVTARLGGGFGYKTPTVFNEESERVQFQGILPIHSERVENERSAGANVDVNYRTAFGAVGFALNQLFFFTRLNEPLVLTNNGSASEFVNADGHIDTKGLETNVRLTYRDFKLFVGYTYADVNTHFGGRRAPLPLTARHRLNNVLMWEKEEQWKVGLEAYYTGRQRLGDGGTGQPYWIMGFMVEKVWEKLSLYVNLENFTDTRQTKFGPIYTGSVDAPLFRDIYAPVDGFVTNGGIKVRL